MDNEEYGIELQLELGAFDKQVEKVKKQAKSIQKAFSPSDVSGLNINYWNDADKNMGGYLDKVNKIKQASKDIGFVNYDASAIQKVVDGYGKVEENVKKAKVETQKLNNETKKTRKTMDFDRITSKLRRFGLALFSIRSIYSLVSRASSAYVSQDTELANKLQSVWVGLGSLLAPVIDKLSDILIKGVTYINIFVKALTGVDLLAKATAKSMNNTAKSAKSLNKALAGFDELTNLDTESAGAGGIDTSWADTFKDIQLNSDIVSFIEAVAKKVRELKGAWDELSPSIQAILGLLGIGGLVGVLTGNWGLVGALAGVSLAIMGFNELINGDTTEAIEGMILLLGGAGLAGAFLGGIKGMSVAIALASVIILFRGFNDLINGDTTDTIKGFIEIVTGTTGLVITLSLIKGGISAILTPLNLIVIGFVAFAAGIALVIKNWNNMSTLERVISILGLIAAGAATAAVAVGALQSAWSLGIAAAAIVAGTAAIAAAVSSANKRARENMPQLATGTNYVPEDQVAMIHKGEAVVPKKFNSREYFGTGNEETNSKLDDLIEAVRNIEINPYTTIRDVGKASLSYINNKSRQLGESVVV